MNYEIDYSVNFNDDFEKLKKSGDKKSLKKLNDLITELRNHPRTGTGHPEALKGFKERDVWSRRISSKHRLVYEIKEAAITVLLISAFGHYDEK